MEDKANLQDEANMQDMTNTETRSIDKKNNLPNEIPNDKSNDKPFKKKGSYRTWTRKYRVADFFCNFIAVSLGVILTFTGSNYLENRNHQNNVKRSMALLKEELNMNKDLLNGLNKRLTLEIDASNYLLRHRKDIMNCPKDSLDLYSRIPLEISTANYFHDALEMLKSSDVMQYIDNKDLVLEIIKVYNDMELLMKMYGMFGETKQKYLDELSELPEIKKYENMNNVFSSRELWNVYFLYPEATQLLQQIPYTFTDKNLFTNGMKEIDNAIACIDKEYK